jgi:hypothetical protein
MISTFSHCLHLPHFNFALVITRVNTCAVFTLSLSLSPENMLNPRQKGVISFSCTFIIFKINSLLVAKRSGEEIEIFLCRAGDFLLEGGNFWIVYSLNFSFSITF